MISEEGLSVVDAVRKWLGFFLFPSRPHARTRWPATGEKMLWLD